MTEAKKMIDGRYEPADNVLHLWCNERVDLKDPAAVDLFFREIMNDWVDRYGRVNKPYLLFNFANLHISTQVSEIYSEHLRKHRARLAGVYRYGVAKDFTGVAVSLGNLKAADKANLFPDEHSARAAIKKARATGG